MAMNEADTRARLVEPKLKAAGWTDQQVTREVYYQRDVRYTPGKIILVGDQARRGQARKADYLLRLTEGFPIAVVEAEPEYKFPDAGLEHATPILRKNTLEENIRQVTERYDAIMTNPPFGGTEGQHIQQNFPIRSQATELLFLQHIMKKLKPRDGARCGMVVPEGLLFRGGAFAKIKRDLLAEFNLHTVVSLPMGIFYASVKTGLIFFERPGPTKETWYYDLPLPEGLKKFSKGNPIRDEHFDEARKLWKAWDAYRKGKGPREACLSERSWIVPVEEIKNRGYDLTARNPNRPEGEELPSPAEIVAELMERERGILAIVEDLAALLENQQGGNADAPDA